jgi:hypothetical protein
MKRFPVLDRAIRQEIIAARTASGLTQRELSAKLRRRNNYIQNINDPPLYLTSYTSKGRYHWVRTGLSYRSR